MTVWHALGWLNVAVVLVVWRLNRRTEKRLAAARAQQRAKVMPAELALTVRSLPPDIWVVMRPVHHIACGPRVLATCTNRHDAERIAALLDRDGVLDLSELTTTEGDHQ